MNSSNAVLYCRSSKDRHDVSIDAQRRDLLALALSRSLTVVAEFTDVVESGSDEDRPGFQALYAALRSPARDWQTILVLDTSRLARRMDIAVIFEEREARPRGVEVVYKQIPDMDPVMRQFMKRQLQSIDELHSMLSRQKGLAGMRENVQQGFRAGGRAPHGYQLRHEATGAVRDGHAVLKSKLELGPAAAAVQTYLRLRAGGLPPTSARREAGLDLATSSLKGMEWNALTYAGCTVWNVHNELVRGHYQGGRKRRPRAEWVIREETHPALITRAEADTILAELEAKRGRQRYRTPAAYLLTGLLVDPAGRAWHGNRDTPDRRYYRLGNRSVRTDKVDRAVLGQISRDLRSPVFIQRLLRAARALAQPEIETDAIARAWRDIEALDGKIARISGMLSETTATRPLLEQIEKYEAEKEKIRAGTIGLETRLKHARAAAGVTERDMTAIAASLADDVDRLDREALKDFLQGMVGRITLDPADLKCSVHYQIPVATGDFVASPRRSADIPRIPVLSFLRLAA